MSNSHSKPKSMKVPADLCLDRTAFLYNAHNIESQDANYKLQLALMEGERRARKLMPLVILSTFSGLLWWPPQGLASSGQTVSFNWILHQNDICCRLFQCSSNWSWRMMLSPVLCTVLEMQGLCTCRPWKFKAYVPSSHNFTILLQTTNKLAHFDFNHLLHAV